MPEQSPLALEPIRARAEAATPGPWMAWREYHGPVTAWRICTHDGNREVVAGDEGAIESGDDAEFIAHARSDVPALVGEVERLRGRMREARALLPAADPNCVCCWCLATRRIGEAIAPAAGEGLA